VTRINLKHILLIFVKYPEPGKVKTRLARDIGKEKAAKIYRAIAEIVINHVSRSSEHKTTIFFDPPERGTDIEKWLENNRCELFPQEGNSLGEKMTNAFAKAFSLGAEKAVIIGTDCVEISDEIVSQAFNALQTVDVVLGPAEDGGYYLLGLKKLVPEIFDGIKWSTDLVLDQTLERVREKGLGFRLLKTLRDIDTVSDLNEKLLLKNEKLLLKIQSVERDQ